MKKLVQILSLLLCFSSVLFAEGGDFSEITLTNEIKSYYQAEYFPGVVDKVNELEKNYPESVYLKQAEVSKAHALVSLGRYNEALLLLDSVLPELSEQSSDYFKCSFLKGTALYYTRQYKKANQAFFIVENAGQENDWYSSSVLFSGRACYELKDYENVITLFEYVISNGQKYTKKEYDEALVKLFHSYRITGNNDRLTKIFAQLNKDDFDEELYSELSVYADQSEKNEADELTGALDKIRSGIAGGKKKPAAAETELLALKDRVASSKLENIGDTYNYLLLYCKALENDWSSVEEYYSKIVKPDYNGKFLYTEALYENGRYSQAANLAKDFTDAKGKNLYGNILISLKKYNDAYAVLGELERKDELKKENYIELAKVYYQLKRYEKAVETANKSSSQLKNYICGISYVNLSDWENAYSSFTKYIDSLGTKAAYWDYASYYKAYSAYKMADYSKAFVQFESYGKKGKNAALVKSAHELAAKSALLKGDFNKAAAEADAYYQCTAGAEERQKAVVFLSDIYADSKKYDEAVKVLQPYTTTKSDFAQTALFKIAGIYEEQGKLEQADTTYAQITKDYPATDKAEEAMYRRGEIYYSKEQYKTAAERFSAYLYQYPNGKYADGACYFSGDSYFKTEDYSRCIMQSKLVISKFSDSVYGYGASRNLLYSYYETEDYTDALLIARSMVRNYSEQAAADGIGTKVVELEKINSGVDRKLVEKASEYERYGKTSTVKGRKAGSELVQLYAENDKYDEALELALALLEVEPQADEASSAAANADFAANQYRNMGENNKAAQLFLKAAGYYRGAGNSEKAASVLYSAADCFMMDGFEGDAKETAKLLKQLYPESRQAQKVDALF